jgi:hypothetical protein
MSSRLLLHEVLEQEYVSMYGPLPGSADGLTDEKRLARVYDAIHERAKDPEKSRTALCVSGGGIRSATFALGVIQGLASAGVLKKFDYLSTVSGGGFIGSWLSSWARRHEDGMAGVERELRTADTARTMAIVPPAKKGEPAGAKLSIKENPPPPTSSMVVRDKPAAPPCDVPAAKIDPEPQPVRHLREYSNYLSPKLGILSGDSWTMGSLYLRNFLLNLLVLVPILAAALAIPRAFSWILHKSDVWQKAWPWHVDLAWPWVFAVFVSLGFAYLGATRPVEQGKKADADRLVKFSADARYMLFCILPLVVAAVGLAVFWVRVTVLGGPDLSHLKQPAIALLTHWSTIAAALTATLVGMMALPYYLYYRRFDKASACAMRTGFASDQEFGKARRRKKWREFFATLVALASSCALLFLAAFKIFDDPLRTTPNLADMSPLQRLGVPALPQAQLFVCFAIPAVLLIFFIQASIFVGISGKRNEDYDREWWGRTGAWLLFFSAAIGLVSFIAVFGPVALYNAPVILGSIGGGAGIVAATLGFSDKTPANQKKKEEGGKTAAVSNFASALFVPLFVVFLLAAISLGTTWLMHQIFRPDLEVDTAIAQRKEPLQAEFTRKTLAVGNDGETYEQENKLPATALTSVAGLKAAAHLRTVQETRFRELGFMLLLAGGAFWLSFAIGVNKFSMAALYRNRLIRAYLGASHTGRDPDNFTGFDADDNLQMWELRPELLWSTSISDVKGFVTALQKQAALWDLLDVTTRKQPVEIALAENLNALLRTTDLSTVLPDLPAWFTKKYQDAYDPTFVNRVRLDQAFGAFIRPMALPEELSDAAPKDPKRLEARGPMHVVNIALNLTTGDNLAWQQRQAASFTVSPYHTGSLRLGYRNSANYGGQEGISLGTAVGISGAAASPNMGYHSSPLVAFLLTFFNVRLGAWLGNPGKCGETSYDKAHPATNLGPMVDELTGSSNARSKWVYLSDGGHFENLGLYEMVLRRCHTIILSDAGADPKFSFEDLGNAIRKIRTDLGVPIDIKKLHMNPRGENGKFGEGRYVAQATIRYSAIDKNAVDGTLTYIKAGVYDDPYFPQDVYNYAMESLEFPHEPTSDQFFSESQFESYRALGRYAINDICGNFEVPENAQIDPKTQTVSLDAKTFPHVHALSAAAWRQTQKRG